jgi:hypothetical protein
MVQHSHREIVRKWTLIEVSLHYGNHKKLCQQTISDTKDKDYNKDKDVHQRNKDKVSLHQSGFTGHLLKPPMHTHHSAMTTVSLLLRILILYYIKSHSLPAVQESFGAITSVSPYTAINPSSPVWKLARRYL